MLLATRPVSDATAGERWRTTKHNSESGALMAGTCEPAYSLIELMPVVGDHRYPGFCGSRPSTKIHNHT